MWKCKRKNNFKDSNNKDFNQEKEVKNEEVKQEQNISKEDEACKDKLVKLQADFENFKARVDREKSDMIFFLKQDILLKILPRLDDLERMLKNTPEEEKKWALYEWLVTLEKKISFWFGKNVS